MPQNKYTKGECFDALFLNQELTGSFLSSPFKNFYDNNLSSTALSNSEYIKLFGLSKYDKIVSNIANRRKILRRQFKKSFEEQYKIEDKMGASLYVQSNQLTVESLQCPIKGCTSTRKFTSKTWGFSEVCSNKNQEHKDYKNQLAVAKLEEKMLQKYGVKNCSQLETIKKKKEITCLKNFGVKNPSHSKAIIKKIKETTFKNYQVENCSQSETIKKKKEITCLKNFGVKNPQQSEDIRARTQKTNKDRYQADYYIASEKGKQETIKKCLKEFGTYNYAKTAECKAKAIKTNMERYGVTNYSKTAEGKAKIIATNMERYGVYSYSKTAEYKLKTASTNMERYGVSHYTQSDAFQKEQNTMKYRIENHPTKSPEEILTEYIHPVTKARLIDKITTDFDISSTTAYKIFENYDVEFIRGVSIVEREIIEYLLELNPDLEIIQGARNIIPPKEIDIYLPSLKLAIEYNGLMFHSQGSSKYSALNTPDFDKDYHLNKTEACESLGIHLLHIQENEWLSNSNGWKSVLKNKIKSSKKIGARKTQVKLIDRNKKNDLLVKEFLDLNHLQGSDAIGPIRYGLYLQNELIQLMTFSKARFTDTDFELIRMCSKVGLSVQGGASKLLKAFEKDNPNKVLVSYANRRWSQGNVYHKLGFALKNISGPNYYYFKPDDIFTLWHRASFQKHKLPKKLDKFDDDLTEKENMLNNGYRRIFDSGNLVFIKNT